MFTVFVQVTKIISKTLFINNGARIKIQNKNDTAKLTLLKNKNNFEQI